MARTEYNPRYAEGKRLTGVAVAAQIPGGRFVKISGDKTTGDTGGGYPIALCGLGDRAFGTSQVDSADPTSAAFSGNLAARDLLVPIVRRGAIAKVTAGTTLTAGTPVQSDANGKAIPVASVAAVAASVATGTVGANTGITYTARAAGSDGNALRVQLKDPAGASQALSVAVSGNDIIVSLATNSGSAITSTATLVIAAIAASAAASSLITAANTGASTGAGTVAAVALTPLTGGVDASTGAVLGIACANATSGAVAEIDLH